MKVRTLLIGILVFYILKQIALVYLIPSWEAPDEPGHVGYISYLYNEKKLPSSYTNFIATSIYESTFLKQHNASFDLNDRRYTSTINVGSHPPLYYLIELVPYWFATMAPSSFTLFILRLPNIAIGVIILYAIYRFIYTLFRKTNVALLVTFLVSLQPMFSFITAIVNSDALVMLCYLSVVYFGWRIMYEKKATKKQWTLFLFISAMAPLSKPHLALVLVIVGYVVLVTSRSVVKTFKVIVLCSIPFMMWLLYNITTYGNKFWGYVVMNQKSESGNLLFYPLEFIATKQPIGIWMSFWGLFGWLNVPMPKWIYILFLCVVCIGIWGWTQRKIKGKGFVFLGGATVLYIMSIVAYDIQYYLLSQTLAIQGRYLAPVLPLLIGAIVWGVMQYRGVVKKITTSFVIGVLVIGQITMIVTILNVYRLYFL